MAAFLSFSFCFSFSFYILFFSWLMLFLSGWRRQKDNKTVLKGDINVGEHKKTQHNCSMSNQLIPTAPSSCFQQTNTDKIAKQQEKGNKPQKILFISNSSLRTVYSKMFGSRGIVLMCKPKMAFSHILSKLEGSHTKSEKSIPDRLTVDPCRGTADGIKYLLCSPLLVFLLHSRSYLTALKLAGKLFFSTLPSHFHFH